MKIKFLLCFLTIQLLITNSFSQTVSVSKHDLVKNVLFLDSTSFIQDLLKSKACNKLYKMARDSSDYIEFHCDFKLNTNNEIKPVFFQQGGIFQQLNLFVKNKFKHYQWQIRPGKVRVIKKMNYYGSLKITMLPMLKIVRLEILISDGEISKNMNSKIVLKKDIPEYLL